MKKLSIVLGALGLSVSCFAATEIATVNGVSITSDEFNMVLGPVNDIQKKEILADKDTKFKIVDQLVTEEAIFQSAQGAKFDKDPAVQKEIDFLKKRYVAQKYLEKTITKDMTKDNLKKYFNSNQKMFDETQAKASHILVSTEAKAKEVLADLNSGKKKFAELAAEVSEDPSAKQNNGDLGSFTRGQMVPEFSDAVFAMKPGEIKGPVKSPFGFHIIQLHEIKKGKAPTFEAAEAKVKEAYRMNKMREFIENAKKTAKIVQKKEVIEKLN